MKVRGRVVSGALSGTPLVEYHFYQLVGTLRFEPYKGTLDIKLNREIDVRKFATRRIERVLMDGSSHVDLVLAEIMLIITRGDSETRHKCWAMQRTSGVIKRNVIEIIDRHSLRGKYSLNDGDAVEIEFLKK